MVEPRAAAAERFVDARFGLFIHWGLHALPARSSGPRGLPSEWIRYHEELSEAEYERPNAWAAEAHNAGMRGGLASPAVPGRRHPPAAP